MVTRNQHLRVTADLCTQTTKLWSVTSKYCTMWPYLSVTRSSKCKTQKKMFWEYKGGHGEKGKKGFGGKGLPCWSTFTITSMLMPELFHWTAWSLRKQSLSYLGPRSTWVVFLVFHPCHKNLWKSSSLLGIQKGIREATLLFPIPLLLLL